MDRRPLSARRKRGSTVDMELGVNCYGLQIEICEVPVTDGYP